MKPHCYIYTIPSLDVSLEHREFLILKQVIYIHNLHHIINTTFKEKFMHAQTFIHR